MSIDQDGREALATAQRLTEASRPGMSGGLSGLGLVTLLEDAASEMRWLVESRARWQAACQVRQISLFEEPRP